MANVLDLQALATPNSVPTCPSTTSIVIVVTTFHLA